MATKALARQRAFNPKDMHDDVYDLARVNPAKLAQNVTRLARRKNQSDGDLDRAERAAVELVGTVGAAAVTMLVGHWDGQIEAVREAMLAQWESAGNDASTNCPVPWEMEGVADPGTAFWVVPKLLIPPVLAGVGAILAAVPRKAVGGRMPMPGFIETLLTRTAQFTFVYAVGSWARAKGYCKRAQQIDQGSYTISITPREDAAAA